MVAVRSFITISPGRRRRSLRDFQGLAGHIIWALNIYPLLRPALCNIYAKIAGKQNRNAALYVNVAIVRDLTWLLHQLSRLPVVSFLESLSWSPADLSATNPADEFVMTDASAWGMGIYFPCRHIGLYAKRPDGAPSAKILSMRPSRSAQPSTDSPAGVLRVALSLASRSLPIARTPHGSSTPSPPAPS